jgi:septal ring factor EnvC (AmiA/AmiB activator)
VRAAGVSAGVLSAVLALMAPMNAFAQSSAAQARRQQAAVQRELEETRKQLEEYRKEEQSLGKELHRIESRTGESRRRVEELRQGVKNAEKKRKELRQRMAAVGQASGYWKQSVQDELRAYQYALAGRDDAFGSADLLREEYRRAAMLDKVELIAGLQGISRTTALAEQEAKRRAADLSQRHKKAQEAQADAQREYESKKAAVAQAQGKVAAAAARAKELEENARALTALIRKLKETPHRAKGGTAPQVAQRWDVAPNSLTWPADGTVVKPFGKQRNPELNTWVISQGIMLQTAAAADVEPVRGGKVIFAGPFKSYGQVLILDHGSNLYSIYGSLGSVLKEKGAEVKPGEVIAKAGAEKDGGGGRVYLELRRGTDAVDPLVWLKKR